MSKRMDESSDEFKLAEMLNPTKASEMMNAAAMNVVELTLI